MAYLATVMAGIALRATLGDEPYFGMVSGDLGLVFVVPRDLHPGHWRRAPRRGVRLASRRSSEALSFMAPPFGGNASNCVCRSVRDFFGRAGLLSGGHAFGSGYAETQAALSGTQQFGLRFALLKWVASLASYMSGIPGGIFAPSTVYRRQPRSWNDHALSLLAGQRDEPAWYGGLFLRSSPGAIHRQRSIVVEMTEISHVGTGNSGRPPRRLRLASA